MSKMSDFKELSIIFDDDAEQWAESFVSNFQAIRVTSCMLNIKQLLPIKQIRDRDQLVASKAILVILSEQLLDYLVKNRGLHLRDCISDPKKGVLFYLNVTENDILQHKLEDRFVEYGDQLWTKMSYDEHSTEKDFQNCLNTVEGVIRNDEDDDLVTAEEAELPSDLYDVEDVQDDVHPIDLGNRQNNATSNDPSGYMKMDKSTKTQFPQSEYTETDHPPIPVTQDVYDDVPQDLGDGPSDTYDINLQEKKERKCAKRQLEVVSVPNIVTCEMEKSEIALCFKEALEGYEPGSMDLLLIDKEDHYVKYEVQEVEQINPYTYKFQLEGHHSEKKVDINVYWKDECVGSCTLEFKSYTPVIDGISNILLEVLDEACTALQTADPEGPTKLDTRLKKTFLSDSTTIRPDAFEKIFGMYDHIEYDVCSKEEIPTLVHLAAKYGLKEMSAKLMDLPSACKACSITNKDQKQPADLAEKHGHFELATFFRNISDIGEDMYIMMNSYDHSGYLRPKQGYYNRTAEHSDPSKAVYYCSDTGAVRRLPVSPHGMPPDQLVYDETQFGPQEDYMPMDKFVRTLNPPPRRGGATGSPAPVARRKPPAPEPSPIGKAAPSAEIYDDADQEPQNIRFTFSMTPAEKQAADEAALKSPIISPEQQELLEINQKVRDDELTIDEAKDLYFEWKRLHENKPTDFRSKNEQMQKMHKLLETKKQNKKAKPAASPKPAPNVKPKKVQEKKGKKAAIVPSSETKVYVRAGHIQRSPASPKPPLKPQIEELTYDDVEDSDPEDKKPKVPLKNFRNSAGSSGSRDSQTSTTDSGVGLEVEDDKAPRRPGPRKKGQGATARKSFSAELPQLPPKLPARGAHLLKGYGKPPPEAPPSPDKTPARPLRKM